MKYFLMLVVATVFGLFIVVNSSWANHNGPGSCPNIFSDPMVYNNWQAGQQRSDYNRSNYHNDLANQYRNQGGANSSYLENNARQWGKLYDNARESSRLYHEFYRGNR